MLIHFTQFRVQPIKPSDPFSESDHLLCKTLALRLLADRVADLHRVRHEDARGAQLPVEHELYSDPARHADVQRPIAEWPDGSPYAASVDVILS